MHVFANKYPINVIIRNGTTITFRNYLELQVYDGRDKGFEYDIPNDSVTLTEHFFGNMDVITIYGGVSNGDLRGIFIDKIYQDLPVRNKTVIDIGANIGDSAIFFALNGAARIIGIEPFPTNYELAEKNIKLNKLNNVSLKLAGCSNQRGEVNIDVDSYNQTGKVFLVKDYKRGIKVPLLTLEDILDENNIHSDGSIILKMDCEGCEYESILSADENTLQKFSHILIEYHHGYKDLKEKLQRSSFEVSVTRPILVTRFYDQDNPSLKFEVGNIFARRK
jgi:FkbM family methyltransferase